MTLFLEQPFTAEGIGQTVLPYASVENAKNSCTLEHMRMLIDFAARSSEAHLLEHKAHELKKELDVENNSIGNQVHNEMDLLVLCALSLTGASAIASGVLKGAYSPLIQVCRIANAATKEICGYYYRVMMWDMDTGDYIWNMSYEQWLEYSKLDIAEQLMQSDFSHLGTLKNKDVRKIFVAFENLKKMLEGTCGEENDPSTASTNGGKMALRLYPLINEALKGKPDFE